MSQDNLDCQVIRVTPELPVLKVLGESRDSPVFRDTRVTRDLPDLQAHRAQPALQAILLSHLKLLYSSVSQVSLLQAIQ